MAQPLKSINADRDRRKRDANRCRLGACREPPVMTSTSMPSPSSAPSSSAVEADVGDATLLLVLLIPAALAISSFSLSTTARCSSSTIRQAVKHW